MVMGVGSRAKEYKAGKSNMVDVSTLQYQQCWLVSMCSKLLLSPLCCNKGVTDLSSCQDQHTQQGNGDDGCACHVGRLL